MYRLFHFIHCLEVFRYSIEYLGVLHNNGLHTLPVNTCTLFRFHLPYCSHVNAYKRMRIGVQTHWHINAGTSASGRNTQNETVIIILSSHEFLSLFMFTSWHVNKQTKTRVDIQRETSVIHRCAWQWHAYCHTYPK